MKFHKVFVKREQWAVVYISTEDNCGDIINSPSSVEAAAKNQIDDNSIWTTEDFKIDFVESCDNKWDMELCDFMNKP